MDLFATYRKAKRVIESCENSDHLKGAKTYMNLWFRSHAERKGKAYYIDDAVKRLYESLQKTYYVTKYKLRR